MGQPLCWAFYYFSAKTLKACARRFKLIYIEHLIQYKAISTQFNSAAGVIMQSFQSSSSGILTSLGEEKSAPMAISLEEVKYFIGLQIIGLFAQDRALVKDFLGYVAQLNDLKKLAVLSRSLADTMENIKGNIQLNQMVKNNSMTLPLVRIFFAFLENIHARTKTDFDGNFDPDIFNIAKTFYTHHVHELNYEYTVARMKLSFLLEVIDSRHYELVELFYQLGANCNVTWEMYGNTPLLFMISDARNSQAAHLLSLADKYPENKLDVNVRSTTFGTNARHLVVAKGYRDRSAMNQTVTLPNLALAELLIQHGATVNSVIEKKDDMADGMTALHLAAARKDMEFCELLIKSGADIHIKDAKGQTPLDLLFINDQEAEQLISHATGNMSCYRQFQPEDASPDKLKLTLITYFEEVHAAQLPKNLKLSAS